MERRNFIRKFTIGGSLLLSVPLVFQACSKDNEADQSGNEKIVDLSSGAFSTLQTVGGFAYKDNIIIIRISESQYVALSKICTHQSCTVSFANSANQLVCPCHGSKFDTTGSVINGPATAALKKYAVSVSGNILKIS